MKCMCAQTRPRFILSSERVLGGMEFEPMLTPREKSPLPENVPRGGSNPRHCGQRAQTLPTELFRPLKNLSIVFPFPVVSLLLQHRAKVCCILHVCFTLLQHATCISRRRRRRGGGWGGGEGEAGRVCSILGEATLR